MTTFTTEDREHAFGATINVEPIPFAGLITIIETPKYKELTDDEIFEAVQDIFVHGKDEDILEFARAILRRAQEK